MFIVWLLVLLSVAASGAPALRWEAAGNHRRAPLPAAQGTKAGFTQMPASETGISLTNRLSDERALTNQILLNGSGVAAGDVDGDGLCDLYFCGLDSPNALYRNLGNWRFEEIAGPAGVACGDQASTGCALADLDGDGDLDLIVNGWRRGTRLFLNEGQGRFREATDAAGLRHESGGASLAIADIDGDGWLDVYVVNYRNDTMRDLPDMRFSVAVTNGAYRLLTVNDRSAQAPDLIGRFTFDQAGGVLENGEADILFRNIGGGKFTRVSWTDGSFVDAQGRNMQTPYDWGLSAMFRDVNGDGAPDLYVCNDFQSPDRFWINDGRGRFRAIAPEALRQTSLFSMGVDFADLNGDGAVDFFVADMLSRSHERRQVQALDAKAFSLVRNPVDDRPQFSRNSLFLNRGQGTFAEIAHWAGVEASEWSWCPAFLDVDLDGYEDLLVTTGHGRDAQNADLAREIEDAKRQRRRGAIDELRLRERLPRLETPNVAFRNRGDLTFEEVGAPWGFEAHAISHGLACADLDQDGDLDVVVNTLNTGSLIYRNEAIRPRVAVRLRGLAPNTRGIGARLRVSVPGLPAQSAEVICGGRYLSSDDCVRTFAAGEISNRVTIEVTWRTGKQSVVRDGPINVLYEFDEAQAASASNPATTNAPSPWFADMSAILNHQHTDAPFDDFARQPLLPRRLSTSGPGVSWIDFNSDGYDDLFVGTGRGGQMAVFRNDGRGGFVRQRAKFLETPADCDLAAVLGWRPDPVGLLLFLGLSHEEQDATVALALRQFSVTTGVADEMLLRTASSTGPMAFGDFDRDGDVDLFVGGRVIGGRYPEPADSAVLRNHRGQLRLDDALSRTFTGVGLVTSALGTDLKGDGYPELVLALEWGPLMIWRWADGRFERWTPRVSWRGASPDSAVRGGADRNEWKTLDGLTGWWNSVAAGDFDGDGRLDLVAGNWGRNHAGARSMPRPLRLYFGEGGVTGAPATVEAHYESLFQAYVPTRDWGTLQAVFPMLHEAFPNFTAFSTARLTNLFAAGLPLMKFLEAAVLDSVILLNRGDSFELRPLPIEAQLAPVFGIGVGDLDGDGFQDLLLAQNFFGVSAAESRIDAGWGLWLRGDGQGGFRAVTAGESGLSIYGEGRGVALSDFDHDGRWDLAVGQHSGATKLYRNARARPALRVRLQGPPNNVQAIGAVIRGVDRGARLGPAQEVRLGGGYWSQDDTTKLVAGAEPIDVVEIAWPGGAKERVTVPPGARVLERKAP